jgi:hypothetical protein
MASLIGGSESLDGPKTASKFERLVRYREWTPSATSLPRLEEPALYLGGANT